MCSWVVAFKMVKRFINHIKKKVMEIKIKIAFSKYLRRWLWTCYEFLYVFLSNQRYCDPSKYLKIDLASPHTIQKFQRKV